MSLSTSCWMQAASSSSPGTLGWMPSPSSCPSMAYSYA